MIRSMICKVPVLPVLAFLLFLTGCSYYQPYVKHNDWAKELAYLWWDKPKDEGCTVSVRMRSRIVEDMSPEEEYNWVTNLLNDGPFIICKRGEPSEMRAIVSLGKTRESQYEVIHYLTLGLIPVIEKYEMHLELKLMDNDGKLLKTYSRNAIYRKGTGYPFLFFRFIALFYPPFWKEMNRDDPAEEIPTLNDMFHDVIKEMYEEDYSLFHENGDFTEEEPAIP